MFRDKMEFKKITVSDCFRPGKKQPYKSRSLVSYIPSPCYHTLIFLSLRKLKNSNMYIKEFMSYPDYQNESRVLKNRYDLSSLMQNEKSKFKMKAGSLVFGTYTIEYNKD